MAKYTVTILTLQKNNFNFGLQNYPIFDEAYRECDNMTFGLAIEAMKKGFFSDIIISVLNY